MLGDTAEIRYTPENINRQLLLGRSRKELAEIFGHKSYKTLDIFMRRKGYQWNRNKGIYELKGVKPAEAEDEPPFHPKKVKQALTLFEKGKDPKEAAKELGFKNHLALAEYMKEKGYLWNHKTQRYERQTGEIPEEPQADDVETISGYGRDEEMLQMLIKNKDKLAEILQLEDNNNLPRYSLSGLRVSKTLQISHKLNELMKTFTEEKNISQREFLEIAAIELMKKHGYEAEVKGILS